MESYSPERKFENRMNTNISIEDMRNHEANNKLSLRKEKRYKNILFSIKEKSNLMHEPHYSIHLNLLKTNNDEIRNFYIDMKNSKETMNKLKFLLSSQDDNEIKYGLYATRKFFQQLNRELYKKEGQNNTNKIDIKDIKMSSEFDLFLNNKIIDLIFQILNKNCEKNDKNAYINIYESLWIFINMTSIYPNKNKKYEFFQILLAQNNLNILINLINNNIPQEIISNVLIIFANTALEEGKEREYIKILINSSLTHVLFNYLKTNKNINKEILGKIYRILFFLYYKYNKLDLEAYKIMFKIFSLPIYNFKDKEILSYCLEMLNVLSNIEDPQIENCFNNINLFAEFNNIIFDDPIEGNEIIINILLEIFNNLITRRIIGLENSNINPGSLLMFYNNLLNKYKSEQKIKDNNVELNIIVSANNLIMMGKADNIKYILGEGLEIFNFFMESARSVFNNLKCFGIKSFLNILMKDNGVIEIKNMYDMVNTIIDTLKIDEFSNCYIGCIKATFLIIKKSEANKFENDLKTYLNNKGFINFLEKIETKLINNLENIKLEEGDNIDNLINIIDEIKYFLNN